MPMPHAPRLLALVVCAALGLLALPADAQWKWKDRTGRVQYSDLPPPNGTPDSDILSRPSARTSIAPRSTSSPLPAASMASAAAASAPRSGDPELEARRKKADAEQAAKVKADQDRIAAAKADNCQRAQANKRQVDSGLRIARVNEKGEREFLDDQQRAAEAKRANDTIAADCK